MNTTLNLKELLLDARRKGVARKAVSTAKKNGKGKADLLRSIRTENKETLRKDIVGLVLTWTDTNPLGDDGCSGLPHAVSHNPNAKVREAVVAAFNQAEYRSWMVSQELPGEVDIELHYALPSSKTKAGRIDPIYFVQRGKMEDGSDNLGAINARIEKLIIASRLANHLRPENKNKGVFQKAVYRITCVDL